LLLNVVWRFHSLKNWNLDINLTRKVDWLVMTGFRNKSENTGADQLDNNVQTADVSSESTEG
jgi:hypothetical protein